MEKKTMVKATIVLTKAPCVQLVPCPICGQEHLYFWSTNLYGERSPGRVSFRYCEVKNGKLRDGALLRI